MAKRKRKNLKSLKEKSPKAYFKEANNLLRTNQPQLALQFANRGMKIAENESDIDIGRKIIGEIYFRQALDSLDFKQRLEALNKALEYLPDESRFHFYKGITLLQTAYYPEALTEFEFVNKSEPNRKGLKYFCELAHICAGGELRETKEFSEKERNTLILISNFLRNESFDLSENKKFLGKHPQMWEALYKMKNDETYGSTDIFDILKNSITVYRQSSISSILQYYHGIAALKSGDTEKAKLIWQKKLSGTSCGKWADKNLARLAKSELLDLLEAQKWKAVINLGNRLLLSIEDNSLKEIISYAYFSLGYNVAQKGQWQQSITYWNQAREINDNRYLAQNIAIAFEKTENWQNATQAWRDMLKRRPRRKDHPDYLTKRQVSLVWQHIADCYLKLNNGDEFIYCQRKAIEYSPNDDEMRFKLIDFLMESYRETAGENELNNLLELQPDNIDALIRLAQYYEEQWNREAMPVWKKILNLDPENVEIKNMVAESYINKAEKDRRFFGTNKKQKKIIKDGLKVLPDHPKLLAYLGDLHIESGENKKAKKLLMKAYNKAPQDPFILYYVISALARIDAKKEVEEIIPEIEKIQDISVTNFWLELASIGIKYDLSEKWVTQFFDEALEYAKHSATDSIASVLYRILVVAEHPKANDYFDYYKMMVEEEVPNHGVLELVKVSRYIFEEPDLNVAVKILKKAKRMAKAANDICLLKEASKLEQEISVLKSMINQYLIYEGLEDENEFF